MADAWNPQQYERFRAQRAQPFHDLLALVQPRPGIRAIDLGCGTGELTRVLHDKLSAAETLGVDSSATMLARAQVHAGGGLRFEPSEIEAVTGHARWDLVFSNAALHWVQDHRTLFARLVGMLAEGGQLAVQIPCNHGHASHRTAEVVAAESPFREALSGWRREVPVLEPDAYAGLLHRLGLRDRIVRLEVYGHELPSRDEVVEWVKGTLFTDYESRLGPELYPRFLDRYREKLLPLLEEGTPYLYTYPRLFIVGRR